MYIKARENRASRVVITAKQGEGSSADMVIDGVRHAGETYSAPQAKAIIDFWKAAAGLDVSDVRRRLVGELRVIKDEIKTNVRLVSIGQQGGLRLTMQIDPASAVTRKADDLGLLDEQMKVVREMADSAGGVVLLAGMPMGGRTTSLYTITQLHDAYTQNVQTVETEPMVAARGHPADRVRADGRGPVLEGRSLEPASRPGRAVGRGVARPRDGEGDRGGGPGADAGVCVDQRGHGVERGADLGEGRG